MIHQLKRSRESGIAACLCESTDSAFMRKGLNNGLPIIPCPGLHARVSAGDVIKLDLASGRVETADDVALAQFRPFCPEMIDVWRAGGLAPALAAWVAAA